MRRLLNGALCVRHLTLFQVWQIFLAGRLLRLPLKHKMVQALKHLCIVCTAIDAYSQSFVLD